MLVCVLFVILQVYKEEPIFVIIIIIIIIIIIVIFNYKKLR